MSNSILENKPIKISDMQFILNFHAAIITNLQLKKCYYEDNKSEGKSRVQLSVYGKINCN